MRRYGRQRGPEEVKERNNHHDIVPSHHFDYAYAPVLEPTITLISYLQVSCYVFPAAKYRSTDADNSSSLSISRHAIGSSPVRALHHNLQLCISQLLHQLHPDGDWPGASPQAPHARPGSGA
ncbi:hypothetical protein H0G86_000349 [Trichoderma simmonsii]|uniref:Uncharacterized protein n=1 Tax=Trichoderma simmonsii TaxID=1491479 RepID=A0A8G0PDV4_9HYPO|nr:hypothetical protein H0G86_000349 [Trichoderma simmonsii]